MIKKVIDNRGSATVEATLVLPLFIFGMLVIYHMIQCKLVENVIYDAATETAEYIAELAYLNEEGIFVPNLYFEDYVDSEDMLDRYVEGGISGIDFLGSDFPKEGEFFTMQINYTLSVDIPFMPGLQEEKTIFITQRYYTGDQGKDGTSDESAGDRYVYVTDNREAYHDTRLCTHLNLSGRIVTIEEAISGGFSPCEYCGEEESRMVIVTDSGDKYHTRGNCSGLKRTIYRVKLSEIGGVQGCLRCVD